MVDGADFKVKEKAALQALLAIPEVASAVAAHREGRFEDAKSAMRKAVRHFPSEVLDRTGVPQTLAIDPPPHRFSALRPHLPAGEACAGVAANEADAPLWARDSMRREEMLPNGVAFLLRGLITATEAAAVLEQADAFGFHPVNLEIRVTDRVEVMAGGLDELLFARARPHLEDVLIEDGVGQIPGQRPKGIPMGARSGRWVPVGLNPYFRVCRYRPGGFFLPHFDEGYDEGEERRSFKTFMLYLNDVSVGGPTSFYSDAQFECRSSSARGGPKEADPQKVIASLQPECGACLVFNHYLIHDGGKVEKGLKYLLRTEVMYQLQK